MFVFQNKNKLTVHGPWLVRGEEGTRSRRGRSGVRHRRRRRAPQRPAARRRPQRRGVGRGGGRGGEQGEAGGALGDPGMDGFAVDGPEVRVARQLAQVFEGGGRADAAQVVPAEEDEAVGVREEGAKAVCVRVWVLGVGVGSLVGWLGGKDVCVCANSINGKGRFRLPVVDRQRDDKLATTRLDAQRPTHAPQLIRGESPLAHAAPARGVLGGVPDDVAHALVGPRRVGAGGGGGTVWRGGGRAQQRGGRPRPVRAGKVRVRTRPLQPPSRRRVVDGRRAARPGCGRRDPRPRCRRRRQGSRDTTGPLAAAHLAIATACRLRHWDRAPPVAAAAVAGQQRRLQATAAAAVAAAVRRPGPRPAWSIWLFHGVNGRRGDVVR
jgi:hypothetical protein